MRTYYRRRRPGAAENAKAAGIAVGLGAAVAAVAFYLARLFLARDRLPPPRQREGPGP